METWIGEVEAGFGDGGGGKERAWGLADHIEPLQETEAGGALSEGSLPAPSPSPPCSALQPVALISPPRPTLATPRWTSPWPWDIGKVGLRHGGQDGAHQGTLRCQMLALGAFMLADTGPWCILPGHVPIQALGAPAC